MKAANNRFTVLDDDAEEPKQVAAPKKAEQKPIVEFKPQTQDGGRGRGRGGDVRGRGRGGDGERGRGRGRGGGEWADG